MSERRTLKVEQLGRVDYGAALDIQKQTERAVLAGEQPILCCCSSTRTC
jgi:hypothetical protein